MDARFSQAAGSLPCVVANPFIAPISLRTFCAKRKHCSGGERLRSICVRERPWSVCSTVSPRCRIPKPPPKSTCPGFGFAVGVAAGRSEIFAWKTSQGAGASPLFPPLDQAIVKALACEVVCETQKCLSRQSVSDLTRRACAALKKPIGRSTVWRILNAADLKPWQYEYWIFPRDPRFAEKAEVILDLYAGFWREKPLTVNDYIVSSDEKTSIQARIRCHPSLTMASGRRRRIEFEYERGGALQYLAAWDVRRGHVMGRCEPTTGIEPFGRLVTQVMRQEPYRSARRVFWVVDNGSSHRGETSIQRLAQSFSKAILVHTPVHASWLNQVEIYFSKIQRKVLEPNEFTSLDEIEQRLRLYENLTNEEPRPFQWKFDRAKLIRFLDHMKTKQRAA
jgi:hypothetical protein